MKILVKAPNWIGDCVMATPALRFLRENAPGAQIDVVCRKGVAGVLDVQLDVNSVYVIDDRQPDPKILQALKAERYDAVALMPNSLRAAWFAWRLGIPRRVGFARAGRRPFLTHAIPYEPALWQTPTPKPLSRKSRRGDSNTEKVRHMVEYYLLIAEATLRALELTPPPISCDRALCDPSLVLPISEAGEQAMHRVLQTHGLDTRPVIAIHPGGAYGGAKRWPLPKLASAATLVARASGADAVVVSAAGPSERAMNAELARYMEVPFLPLGEHLDLPALAAFLTRVRVLISNDSGVMHLAAAVGTPTVAVFGPTDWNVTAPWSRRACVVRKSPPCAPCFLRECPIEHLCMNAIAPADVAAAALALMRKTCQEVERG